MQPITPDDATRSLGEIDQVRAKSQRAYGYESYSRYLILWGVVWVAGQGASLAWPGQATYVWWGLVAAAIALTCILPRRPRRAEWRVPAVVLIALGLVFAAHLALGPASPRMSSVLLPLVTAAIYLGMGLWLGLRFSIIGLVLGACILLGVFTLGDELQAWMGFLGGGTLVLGGFWLRKI
jgi:hypothetical protein